MASASQPPGSHQELVVPSSIQWSGSPRFVKKASISQVQTKNLKHIGIWQIENIPPHSLLDLKQWRPLDHFNHNLHDGVWPPIAPIPGGSTLEAAITYRAGIVTPPSSIVLLPVTNPATGSQNRLILRWVISSSQSFCRSGAVSTTVSKQRKEGSAWPHSVEDKRKRKRLFGSGAGWDYPSFGWSALGQAGCSKDYSESI